jgi:hypothetical protein
MDEGTDGKRGPSRSLDGVATLIIAAITATVFGWVSVELWRGEYVAPIIYPVLAGLPVILVAQVVTWWQTRRDAQRLLRPESRGLRDHR